MVLLYNDGYGMEQILQQFCKIFIKLVFVHSSYSS